MLSESVAQESGAGQGQGAGEEVTVVLSPITVPGPSSECASVGVSCVTTEQRGRGPEPETLPL